MKTTTTAAALDLANKAIFAIQTVQIHLIDNCKDDMASLALDSAITEIEAVGAIIKDLDNAPAPIEQRISKLNQPIYSESFLSEFFEWLESTGEWTCDCTVFDSAWQRFKKSQA